VRTLDRTEWDGMARRLTLAWPSEPVEGERSALYYELLSEIPAEWVRRAVDDLVHEDRETSPPPGLIRSRALAQSPTPLPAAPTGPDPAWPPAPVVTAPVAPAGRTSGKAVAAMVLGICGILVVPVVCGILGVVFGWLALKDTGRDPTLGGRGMAIAGLACGAAGLVLWTALIVAAIASDAGYWST
jgi:hypothetical protein